MVIKERAVITWLLNTDMKQPPNNLVIAPVEYPLNASILNDNLIELDYIRQKAPEWGLPELLMPTFVEVMKKS